MARALVAPQPLERRGEHVDDRAQELRVLLDGALGRRGPGGERAEQLLAADLEHERLGPGDGHAPGGDLLAAAMDLHAIGAHRLAGRRRGHAEQLARVGARQRQLAQRGHGGLLRGLAAQLALGGQPLGDVAPDGQQQRPFVGADDAPAHLADELRAVGAQPVRALGEAQRVLGGEVELHVAPVAVAHALGPQHLHRAPDELVLPVAEQLLGELVDEHDPPVARARHRGVRQALEHGAQRALAAAQPLAHGAPRAGVAHVDQRQVLQAARRDLDPHVAAVAPAGEHLAALRRPRQAARAARQHGLQRAPGEVGRRVAEQRGDPLVRQHDLARVVADEDRVGHSEQRGGELGHQRQARLDDGIDVRDRASRVTFVHGWRNASLRCRGGSWQCSRHGHCSHPARRRRAPSRR